MSSKATENQRDAPNIVELSTALIIFMHIKINILTQTMTVYDKDRKIRCFLVSTGINGVGELIGSEKTPRGWHIIRAKIGDGCPENMVFVDRRPTGEIYNSELKLAYPDRDWVLTRILWLSGLEVGKNRLGLVDTMRRYVYIHGSPDEAIMGKTGSRGCIRMHNADVIELFDLMSVGERVCIDERE